MKYIGSKTKLLDFIDEALRASGITHIESFADVFAGTGAVAAHVAKKYRPGRVLLNDIQYYSHVLCRARFEGPKHGKPLPETISPRHGFISENYADMYFTKENARRIDGWLSEIRPDDFYAKACLLDAVTKVSNTACVYENYLKHMSRRALSALVVRPVDFLRFPGKIEYLNQRAEDIVSPDTQVYDVVYLDPPYNGRKYATNYHILETIARNDRPDLRCKAKIRADADLSAFNSRRKVREALGRVLDNWKSRCKHLCMSYNSEGIMPKNDIMAMLKHRGYKDVRVYEKEYPRFSTHASDKTKTVFEYVFVASGLKGS